MTLRPAASKLIIELRFKTNFNYVQNVFGAVSEIEDQFDNWNANTNPSSAVLFNESTKTSLMVSTNVLRYVCEDSKSFNGLMDELRDYIAILLGKYDIADINRLGVRRISIYEDDGDYSGIVKQVNGNMLGADNSITELIADKITDSQFVFDTIKDGFENHLVIAPLKQSQYSKIFQSEFDKDFELKKKANVLVDIDTYKDEIGTLQELDIYLDTALEINAETSKDIFERIKV